ncbi:MAG: HD domain-containing phosphohydrolase [Candidatus Krumholzibacteriia bacterium]
MGDINHYLLRQVRWAELTVGLLVVLVSRELAALRFPLPPVLALFAGAAGVQALLALLAGGARPGGRPLPALPILLADAAVWLPLLALTGGAASPYLFLLLFPACHAGLLCASARVSLGATLGLLGGFAAVASVAWPGGDPTAVFDRRLVLGVTLMLGALLLSVTHLVRTARGVLLPGWVATPEPVDSLVRRTADNAGIALGEDGDFADLLEETVLVLSRVPGVAFAAAITGPGWPAEPDDERGARARGIAVAAGQPWPQWLDLTPRSAAFFAGAAGDPERPFHAGPAAALRDADFPPAAAARFDRWLLAPLAGRAGADLAVLVGLRSREADEAYLKMTMVRLGSQLAPLLAASGHLARLRGELASLHAENETLTRINKMQSDFVAVASHELKTPLTSISAYTEALLSERARPDFTQAGEFLGIIREESERLLRMVNRILDFSRLEFGQRLLNRCVLDLEPLIRETSRTLDPLLAAKGLRLVLDVPALLPRVEIDADLIRQVLINLLNNAIKYTPSGGTVTVSASEDAATVRVAVTDTGPGIPADELRRIFRQFYRVSGASEGIEGAGLGLSIVKNIIDLHGGHIDVQSTVGHGSSFIFHLPKEHQLNPVTAAILGDLTTRPQFQQLLRLTVRMVAEMTESKIVSLMLLDKDGRNLVVQSAYGLNESIVKSAHVAIGKGIAGRVLQSGRPLLVADVVKDGLIESANRHQYETHSLVSVPLRIGDRAVGVINVNNKVSGAAFNEDDLTLVTTLSDKVSAALEQAMQADSSARRVEKIVDALQALIVMKRNAIPTATPLARRLLVETARRLGLNRAEIRRLQYVASVHDVGMVAVDEEILHKAGPLTDDEHDEVTLHPEQGVSLVAPLLQAPEMSQIIMTHHERVDGSGYPRGLQGLDIPLGARILAVVDAFFAMSQERPWHESRPAAHAVAELRGNAGRQFDADVVEAFVAVLDEEGLLDPSPDGPPAAATAAAAHEREGRWQPQGS